MTVAGQLNLSLRAKDGFTSHSCVQQDSGEGFWQVLSFPKENCIKLKTLSIASLGEFVHSSDGILTLS